MDFKLKVQEPEETPKGTGVLKFHNIQGEDSNHTFLKLKKNESSPEIKKKKFKNHNYFSVKNHIDLFEIGNHYVQLFEGGFKSFAFSGCSQTGSVHHSMLGLASFFNFHKNLKAVIFIDKFEGSELQKFLKPTHVELELIDPETDESIEYYSCDGIDVYELSKIRHLAYKVGADIFSEFLQSLLSGEKIILWALPRSADLDKEREFYLPIIQVIDSLSFVIDEGKTSRNDLEQMYQFMNKYQVQVEGSIFYKK